MSAFYYRLLPIVVTGLSLALAGTVAGCGGDRSSNGAAAAGAQTAASSDPGEIDSEATIWTVLGIAKEDSAREPGPQTGATVSPVLWQATHDTLDFVELASDDPLTGQIVTAWYSPKGHPDERFRVTVFILSRALRSDSIAVTVDREARAPGGQWAKTTVTRTVENDLINAILFRARQIRHSREPNAS